MHSIRFQFISFITGLLLILLILLNTYPITSSRDAVFEEKRSSLDGQAATLAASLSGLERPSRESVAEVLRFLDLSGFSRIVVTDADGLVIYDTQPGTVGKQRRRAGPDHPGLPAPDPGGLPDHRGRRAGGGDGVRDHDGAQAAGADRVHARGGRRRLRLSA